MEVPQLKNDTDGCASLCGSQENDGNCFADSLGGADLRNELLRRICAEGLEKPTPLQQNVIVPWLKGQDFIIHACAHTGKTTALAIAVLQSIDASFQHCQVLILVPHKQRALSIAKKLSDLCDFENFRWHVASSSDPEVDVAEVDMAVHVVIATAGSAYDLVKRKVLQTDFMKMVVLEDSPRALSARSYAQIWEIFKTLKHNIQVILMSNVATVDSSNESRTHLQDTNFEVKKDELNETDIQQVFRPAIVVNKLQVMFALHGTVKYNVSPTIIFFEKNSSAIHRKEKMQNSTTSTSSVEDSDSRGKKSERKKIRKKLKIPRKQRMTIKNQLKFEKRACDNVLKNGLHLPVEIYDGGSKSSFDSLNLRDDLLQGISAHNLKEPTALQEKVIAQYLQGFDVVAQGLPGTGKKTAASIAALQSIDVSLQGCQVLILTLDVNVTHNLVQMLNHLGNYMKFQCCPCIFTKAASKETSFEDFRASVTGAQIVVGTARNVAEVIRHGHLATDNIKLLVLEDADRMLSFRSQKSACFVLRRLNSKVQKISLSHFMSVKNVNDLKLYLKSPVCVVPKNDEFTLNYKQFYIQAAVEMKSEALFSLYETLKITKAVIFCARKNVSSLSESMEMKGFKVSAIDNLFEYYEKSDQIHKNFLSDDSHTLITTDVIESRSIPQVPVVINFHVPFKEEIYLRRICRHPEGVFISIVAGYENKHLEKIKKFYKTKITKMQTFHTLLRELSISSVTEEICDGEITTDENENSSSVVIPETHFYSYSSIVESSFKEINLQKELLEGIQQSGFTKPTPLQHSAITPFLEGHNIVIDSCPKTGKKTFISLAALQNIDYGSESCQVLILSNREGNIMAIQKLLNQLCGNAQVFCCSNDRTGKKEITLIKQKQPHILLGHPWRVSLLISKKALQTSKVKTIIIDNADRIFSVSLRKEVLYVLGTLDSNVQVILLSKSVEKKTLDDFRMFLHKPLTLVGNREMIELQTKQFYVFAADQIKKLELLHHLVEELPITEAVVFCNTKEEAMLLSEETQSRKVLSCISCDKYQDKETEQLNCNCSCISVVKTDAEATNVNQKSVFINYSLHCMECYIDRIKRINVSRKENVIISFTTEEEVKILDEVIDTYRTDVVRLLYRV